MLKSVGLEGVPCSGKTSMAKKIILLKKYNIIWEPETRINNIDYLNNEDIRETYALLEMEKKVKLLTIDKNVLLDRTFFSSLAYSYSKYFITGDKSDFEFNSYFYKMNKDRIIIPDNIYVFEITPEESIRRRISSKHRDPHHIYWTNVKFINEFSKFFHSKLFFDLYPKENVFFINTQNLNKSETYTRLKLDFSKILF